MRIAIVAHGRSPFGFMYAEAFRRAGHDAELLVLTRPPDRCIDECRLVGPAGFRPWESRGRASYLRTILPLRRALRRSQPDLVFALYLSSGGLAATLSGHPRVVISALGSDVNLRLGSRLWRAVFGWEARRAALVHAVSDDLASKLTRWAGVGADRIVVAPIGIDTERLGLVDSRTRPNRGRIVSTRAHDPIYDQATLVRAAARLEQRRRQFHVTFAGWRFAETTRELVARAGLDERVTFLDGYEADELPSILGSADVYVSCSKSDGTSQSLLEAMSTGIFPVVSDIPANRPWIKDGHNGLLFAVGDDAALADLLERALDDTELRATAAEVNRRIVLERGDLHRGARTLLDAFERCLGTSGGVPS